MQANSGNSGDADKPDQVGKDGPAFQGSR
jgi:hypothetical protein